MAGDGVNDGRWGQWREMESMKGDGVNGGRWSQ